MWPELRQVFEHLHQDPLVRVIILSGAGDRAFTAGLDVKGAAQQSILKPPGPGEEVARKAFATRRFILDYQSCASALEAGNKPVVCILHGISYGMAIDLSSAADVRIGTADLQACVKEVDIGLAADVGTLTRLPKTVGNHSWVKDVSLTARVFGAEEALRVGFISAIAPDKKAAVGMALQWAQTVAAKSPVAVQGTKVLLNYSRDHTTAEGLDYTAVWNAAMLQTHDTGLSMKAAVEKKNPRFEKL